MGKVAAYGAKKSKKTNLSILGFGGPSGQTKKTLDTIFQKKIAKIRNF
jgi:hypothetical protein